MNKPNKFTSLKQKTKQSMTLDQILLENGPPSVTDPVDGILRLPTNRFYASDQVRLEFDEEELLDLSKSLKNESQTQPIRVYPQDPDGRYKIFHGERRWRAASLIPDFLLEAVVDRKAVNLTELKRTALQFIDNDKRSNLSVWETAIMLSRLMDLAGSQEAVAETIGWYVKNSDKPNVNKVSRHLNILKLPETGIELVKKRVISDLTVIELLRKISELDMDQYKELESGARLEPLSRGKLEAIYKKLQHPPTIQPASPSTKSPLVAPDLPVGNVAGPSGASEVVTINDQLANTRADQVPKNQSSRKPSPSITPSLTDSGQAVSPIVPQPVIKVQWQNLRTGVIDFDRDIAEPSNKSVAVKLDNGDHITAEVSELKIKSIDFINCSHRQLLAQKSRLVAHIQSIAVATTPEELKEALDKALAEVNKA